MIDDILNIAADENYRVDKIDFDSLLNNRSLRNIDRMVDANDNIIALSKHYGFKFSDDYFYAINNYIEGDVLDDMKQHIIDNSSKFFDICEDIITRLENQGGGYLYKIRLVNDKNKIQEDWIELSELRKVTYPCSFGIYTRLFIMPYGNRDGDLFWFIYDGKTYKLWGNFLAARYGMNDDENISFFDPSGGPMISVGGNTISLSNRLGNFLIKGIGNVDEKVGKMSAIELFLTKSS